MSAPFTQAEELILIKKAQNGDTAARNKLISGHRAFVYKLVFTNYYVNDSISEIQDLVNEGLIGLIKAVDLYDTSSGFKFISYAVWWVKATINKYLQEKSNRIRLPANVFSEIQKAKSLRISKGKELTDRQEEIANIEKNTISISSLPPDMDEGRVEAFIDNSEDFDNNLMDQDLSYFLNHWLNFLPERERVVLTQLYGLEGGEPLQLKEVANQIGVCHERVRQIRDKGLRILRSKKNLFEESRIFLRFFSDSVAI